MSLPFQPSTVFSSPSSLALLYSFKGYGYFKRDETFVCARVLASFYHRHLFSIPLPLRSLVHYPSPSVVLRSLIIVQHCWFFAPHRALSLLLCSSPCLAVIGGWSRRVLLPCLLEVEATFLLLSGLTPALCFSSYLFSFARPEVEIVPVFVGSIPYLLLSKSAKGVEKTSSHFFPKILV
ncbi:hypothetical protein S83_055128, partial [Arachis hypogaea]